MHELICRDVSPGSDGERTLAVRASDDTVDSYGEIVDCSTMKLDRYLKNPIVLYAHNSRELPIGRATSVRVDGKALVAQIQLAAQGENARADEVWRSIKGGHTRGISIGFVSGEQRIESRRGEDVVVLGNCELHEISIVSLPANPNALISHVKSAGARRQMAGDDALLDEVFGKSADLDDDFEGLLDTRAALPQRRAIENTDDITEEVLGEALKLL